jgi:hypothetical protein
MPIKKGKSKKVIKENIEELVESFEKTGKIGSSKPKSKKAAARQAVAIAYSSARKSKKK